MFCCFKLCWISDFHDRQKQSPRGALQKKHVLKNFEKFTGKLLKFGVPFLAKLQGSRL